MMTARDYFYENAIFAVEVEFSDDNSRHWYYEKGSDAVQALTESVYEAGDYLSDIDFAGEARQDNTFVRKVLKLTSLNWWENKSWMERNNLKSYEDVLHFILDNGLYKAS